MRDPVQYNSQRKSRLFGVGDSRHAMPSRPLVSLAAVPGAGRCARRETRVDQSVDTSAVKEAVLGTRHQSVAVDEPLVETLKRRQIQERTKPERQPRYHVILWDDNDHSYEYVIHMMRKLFGHPLEKGLQIAKEVDSGGRAICLTTTKEHAELKRDQIHAFGKDSLIARCVGSMWSTIEPETV